MDTVTTGVLGDDEAQFRVGDLGWITGKATPGGSNFTRSEGVYVTEDLVALVFVTERGKRYTIFQSNTLSDDGWEQVDEVEGTGFEEVYSTPRASDQGFFRIEKSPLE